MIGRLIHAYFETERYPDLIRIAKKVYSQPQFARSEAHLLYARALDRSGDKVAAEQEFKKMKGRFTDFEARYQYGLFLRRAGRDEECREMLEDIVKESSHLSSRERRFHLTWIQKSKEEVKKV